METTSTKAPSKTNHAMTPPWLAQMAREVLDVIDLDPASSARANKVMRAESYYTPRENGLRHRWTAISRRQPCRIWLNPPGGIDPRANLSRVKIWWNYLLEERKAENIRRRAVSGLQHRGAEAHSVWLLAFATGV